MGMFLKKLMLYVRKFDQYMRRYEIASKVPAIPAEAFVNMGLYWASLGEYEKAKTEFETSASMMRPSPEAYVNFDNLLKIVLFLHVILLEHFPGMETVLLSFFILLY